MLAAAARAVAGILEATAVSLAFVDPASGELVYEAAWGAGAEHVVGMRLAPGVGVAGAVLTSGQPAAVADCRADARFAAIVAAETGYIPHTMVAVPLRGPGLPPGILQALDRRDGSPYTNADVERALSAAELVRLALSSPERADDRRLIGAVGWPPCHDWPASHRRQSIGSAHRSRCPRPPWRRPLA